MKRISLYILIVVLFSCKKDEDTITVKENLTAFHTLILDDSFEVYVKEEANHSIEMQGIESFVKKMNYNLTDSVLTIRNDKKLKWTDPKDNTVKLWISAQQLKLITANESCDIKSQNPITTPEFGLIVGSKANEVDLELNNEIFYYWNNFPCGGKITLRGISEELKIWNYAIMSIDASALSSKKAYIENHSKGKCSLDVSDFLEYKIEGEGDILVYGQPAEIIKQSENGSGRLIVY